MILSLMRFTHRFYLIKSKIIKDIYKVKLLLLNRRIEGISRVSRGEPTLLRQLNTVSTERQVF